MAQALKNIDGYMVYYYVNQYWLPWHQHKGRNRGRKSMIERNDERREGVVEIERQSDKEREFVGGGGGDVEHEDQEKNIQMVLQRAREGKEEEKGIREI